MLHVHSSNPVRPLTFSCCIALGRASLDPARIKLQDATSVITLISQNRGEADGQALAWSFLRQSWDDITERFEGGNPLLANMIREVVGGFQTQAQYEEAQAFFSALPEDSIGTARGAVEQALDRAASNLQWQQDSLPDVRLWLLNEVGAL